MQIGPSARQILQRAAQAIQTRTPAQLTPAQQAARRWSLAQFTQAAWHVVEPSTPLIWNWHLDAICMHVQALLERKLGKQNLLICVPPGSMKSTIVSVMAPAWMWIRRPDWRATFAAGAASVAVRDSLRTRAIVESVWYRSTFAPSWSLSSDANQKTAFENTTTGFRQATTTGAKITGQRPHAIFCDDPLDAGDTFSKAAREACATWWMHAYANRIADPTSGSRCLIAQRLHQQDLPGVILETEGADWEQLIIPMEHEESRRIITSLGWTDPRQEDGALMFPQRFTPAVVAAERARLGRSGFDGQHQQRPSAAEGELFRNGCLQLWPASEPLPQFSRIVQSWDTAFSERTTADYSVGFTLGQFDRGVMILDRVRARLSFPELKVAALQMAAAHPPSAVLVEYKASGQSLVQVLQQETALPIVPVNVGTDKVSRANACVPAWESGRVFALANLPWLAELLDELTSFPKAPHDDMVDSLSQALIYLMQQPDGSGIMDYYDKLASQVEAAAAAPEAQPTAEPPWRRGDAVASDLGAGLMLPGSVGYFR